MGLTSRVLVRNPPSTRLLHSFDRFRTDARGRSLRWEADAQVGNFLDQGPASTGGEGEDVTAPCLAGAQKMEMPPR